MNNNRIIAEWAGWKKKDRSATTPIRWTDDDLVVGDVAYWEKPPPYDAELAFWHGKHGLLAEIKEKGISVPFTRAVEDIYQSLGTWTGMTALPSQLAEALVEVIKEAE